MTEFRGSYTVTVTPFTEDGSAIDEAAQRRFVDWQLAEGVPGLIILGTTAEFLTISDDERNQLIEITIDQVAGRVPVLMGASAPTARQTIAAAEIAAIPDENASVDTRRSWFCFLTSAPSNALTFASKSFTVGFPRRVYI